MQEKGLGPSFEIELNSVPDNRQNHDVRVERGVGKNPTFEKKNCPDCSRPQKPGILIENVYSDSKIRRS